MTHHLQRKKAERKGGMSGALSGLHEHRTAGAAAASARTKSVDHLQPPPPTTTNTPSPPLACSVKRATTNGDKQVRGNALRLRRDRETRARLHNIIHKLAAAGSGARNKAAPCGIPTHVSENGGLREQKGIKNIPDDLA